MNADGQFLVVMLVVGIVVFLITAALGAAVAGENARGLGFMLGFLLGPIGLIIAAIVGMQGRGRGASQSPALTARQSLEARGLSSGPRRQIRLTRPAGRVHTYR